MSIRYCCALFLRNNNMLLNIYNYVGFRINILTPENIISRTNKIILFSS